MICFKMRPEISTKNKYWISKHRYYELKHFCLQYQEWKNTYNNIDIEQLPLINLEFKVDTSKVSNPTENIALLKILLSEKMSIIESAAKQADEYLHNYILKGVTEGLSYDNLRTNLNIPCGKDMYYDRYRKFFWILSTSRQ